MGTDEVVEFLLYIDDAPADEQWAMIQHILENTNNYEYIQEQFRNFKRK